MKTLLSDAREQYSNPDKDKQLQVESFAVRINGFDTILTRILPSSLAAVEKHYQNLKLGGTSMAGNAMFMPRSTASAVQLQAMPEKTKMAYEQVAQVGNYAPLGEEDEVALLSDLIDAEFVEPTAEARSEYRAYDEPINSLKDVNPTTTAKLDEETARKVVEAAHRNSAVAPESRLPLWHF